MVRLAHKIMKQSNIETTPRVLVVEDEPDIAALIAYQLTREGFRVETIGNGTEALVAIDKEAPDLVVLDRMLPGLSGDEVIQRLRDDPETLSIPVLMLTAKREQEDRIEGLELGADDYLTKPFSPRELVLRVQAVLRRAQDAGTASGGRVLRAGPLRMDLASHRVLLRSRAYLTPTEFRLLELMERRVGPEPQTATERVWYESGISDRIQTRTVDTHVTLTFEAR